MGDIFPHAGSLLSIGRAQARLGESKQLDARLCGVGRHHSHRLIGIIVRKSGKLLDIRGYPWRCIHKIKDKDPDPGATQSVFHYTYRYIYCASVPLYFNRYFDGSDNLRDFLRQYSLECERVLMT